MPERPTIKFRLEALSNEVLVDLETEINHTDVQSSMPT